MFGLSKQEIIIKVIKNACTAKIDSYRSGIKMIAEILSMPDAKDDIPQEKISKLAETTRINYLNAVCDAVWESLSVSSPNLSDRFHIALLSPRIAGLPDEFTTEYLSTHGISAVVVFGLMYFAVTGKSVEIKHFKTMSMLNHYQNDLMNEVLIEFKQ